HGRAAAHRHPGARAQERPRTRGSPGDSCGDGVISLTRAGSGASTRPFRLRSGDRIALVAPGSSFKGEDLTAGVAELKTLGFDAVYDERVFERGPFVAGSPATRAAVIEAVWRYPKIRALIAIRGGYGSAQLLPLLDVALMRDARKIFVGY